MDCFSQLKLSFDFNAVFSYCIFDWPSGSLKERVVEMKISTAGILKYLILSVLFLAFVCFLIKGYNIVDYQKGIYKFRWSGIGALFSTDEFGLGVNKRIKLDLGGPDGPYIEGSRLYYINRSKEMEVHELERQDRIKVYVDNEDQDSFEVELREKYESNGEIFEMPPVLLALSDIEGNYDAFYSLLISAGVMNEGYDWTFGIGHLVLIGDFVDRGSNVTQVLWLIYNLEGKAEKKGGRVHYLLGNHEIMNIRGRTAYIQPKYIRAYQIISGKADWDEACRHMFSCKTELGAWIRSKNTAVKVGDILFVHGGLSPGLINRGISIPEINRLVRQNLDSDLSKNSTADEMARFLFGAEGPMWYRGLVRDYQNYKRARPSEVSDILAFYNSSGIVVGHCIVEDISAAYEGRVVMADLLHGRGKHTGQTKGLLIEDGIFYILDDRGNRKKL